MGHDIQNTEPSLGFSFLEQHKLDGSNLSFILNDAQTGADLHLTVFQPNPPEGYFYLGHVAVPGYPLVCPLSCVIVKPINDDSDNPCLKPVESFSTIWENIGAPSGLPYLSFCLPACSDENYVAIGAIGYTSDSQSIPQPKNYPGLMLVRQDLVFLIKCDQTVIWDDAGSGLSYDVSLFSMPNSNYFICSVGQLGVPPSGKFPDLPLLTLA